MRERRHNEEERRSLLEEGIEHELQVTIFCDIANAVVFQENQQIFQRPGEDIPKSSSHYVHGNLKWLRGMHYKHCPANTTTGLHQLTISISSKPHNYTFLKQRIEHNIY